MEDEYCEFEILPSGEVGAILKHHSPLNEFVYGVDPVEWDAHADWLEKYTQWEIYRPKTNFLYTDIEGKKCAVPVLKRGVDQWKK